MSIVPAPKITEKKSKDKNSTALTEALSTNLSRLITTSDGRQMTAAQAMAERLVNISIFAEANSDAIAAQKLIYDRVQGKAAVMKVDETKPMPKVVFALTEDGLDKVNASRNLVLDAVDNDEDESLVIAEMDGKSYVG
ncbi:MAG: hypothetical protein MJZ37_00680 [Bacilli bacterium]|nr:hypothetical protein [Bacilli bacterium]